MKTIRFFALLILGALAFSASAQSSSLKEDLKEAVEEINEECPMKIDEDITLSSVAYIEPNIVMTFNADVEDEVIDELGRMKEEISKTMIDMLTSDDDGFIDICKATKSNVKIVFKNPTGRAMSAIISYKEM